VKVFRAAVALAFTAAAVPAIAGPPYLTDDPIPTDTGHWEIYGFTAGQRAGSAVDADAGLDLNYGPVAGIQLTATLPLGFSHEQAEGWRSGTGDVELGVKYRFFKDERAGVSAAIFPRAILPTSTIARHERTRLLLPVWLQKDFPGRTSLFGGGGYEINPGPGNRDFWLAAAALTHDFGKGVSAGMEVAHQSPDSVGATSETDLGAGTIIHISGPASLLTSVGPTWIDHHTGYHLYLALGLNF
jgi:hypothetical protein